MKGLALSFTEFFQDLVAIGIMTLLVLIGYGTIVDIHTIVEGSQVERHTTLIGNVFLSSDKLALVEDGRIQRAVFDKEKLDKELINQNNFLDYIKIITGTSLFDEISYPESRIILSVTDLESEDVWFLIGGSAVLGGESVSGFAECLISKIKIDLNIFFRRLWKYNIMIPSLWDQQDFDSCIASFESKSSGNLGILKTFPIAIRVSDKETHVGTLGVRLWE